MVGVDGTCLVVAWYYSGTRGAMVYALAFTFTRKVGRNGKSWMLVK
jgi:hypothetical protein